MEELDVRQRNDTVKNKKLSMRVLKMTYKKSSPMKPPTIVIIEPSSTVEMSNSEEHTFY